MRVISVVHQFIDDPVDSRWRRKQLSQVLAQGNHIIGIGDIDPSRHRTKPRAPALSWGGSQPVEDDIRSPQGRPNVTKSSTLGG